MPITFVGSAVAASTSVTIPAHQAGDLLIIQASEDSSTTPALPAGWTSVLTGTAGSTNRCRIGYRIASGSGTSSGTWTGAQVVSVSVFRGVDQADPIGAFSSVGTSNFTFPALTLEVTDGSSWVFGAIASYFYAPGTATGLTRRQQLTSAASVNSIYDTDTGVSSFSSRTASGSVFGTNSINSSIEIKAGASAPTGTDYEETATALGSSVSLTASGTKGSSATSSLGATAGVTATGIAAASATGSLNTEASLSATGSAAASATSELDTSASVTAAGSAAAEADSGSLGADAALTASGTKGADTSASDLAAAAAASASGTATANASADLDVVTDAEASGTADASASTSLDTAATLTPAAASAAAEVTAALESALALDATGTAVASSSAALDAGVTVEGSGVAAASATASLDTVTSIGAAGSAAASSEADALSASAGSEPTNVADFLVASNLLEATVLFTGIESELSTELSASFSLSVDFESPIATASVEDSASFPVSLGFGFVDTDGSNSASVEFTVRVSFSEADPVVSAASTASLESLVILEDGSSFTGYSSEATLAVDAGYGSVTVQRSLDWSIYISLSEVTTNLPVDLLVTTIPDLSDCACIPTLEISTVIPEDGVQTVIDGTAINTVIGDTRIATSLPFDELVTSIPDAAVDTLLEEE